MKLSRLLILPLFLAGCIMSNANSNTTANQPNTENKNFITSLIILDCSYRNQGCAHAEGFTTCVYHLTNTIEAMSEQQRNILEQNLRTQYGFNQKSDSEINDAADMVLTRYLQCKKT